MTRIAFGWKMSFHRVICFSRESSNVDLGMKESTESGDLNEKPVTKSGLRTFSKIWKTSFWGEYLCPSWILNLKV